MKNRNEFLLIVDGSSLLATSYYASLPRALRKEKDEEKKEQMYPRLLKQDKQGHYCNALELFFHTLFTIVTFQRPSHLVICWDAGRNTFRKELWPAYKSNRQATPTPLRQQFETAYALCGQLGISQVRDTRYEADDFAGTIATRMCEYIPVRILTRDKDYFQLINDDIHIWYGMADLKKVKAWRKTHNMPSSLPSRVVLVNEDVLYKEFGYHPKAVPMIKCLFGDPSDNIPGVSGMGENRSIKLAEHYHSVAELYDPIDAVRTKADRQKLARLWRTWGITISPYSVLTRKGTDTRLNARQMAEICYELGKIRTDLDLEDCFEGEFGPDLFRCEFDPQTIFDVLEPFEIELKIGRKKNGIPGRPFNTRHTSGRPGAKKRNSTQATSFREGKKSSATKSAKSVQITPAAGQPKGKAAKAAMAAETMPSASNVKAPKTGKPVRPTQKSRKGSAPLAASRKQNLSETQIKDDLLVKENQVDAGLNVSSNMPAAPKTTSSAKRKSRKAKGRKNANPAKLKKAAAAESSPKENDFSLQALEQFEASQPFEVVVAGFDDGQEEEYGFESSSRSSFANNSRSKSKAGRKKPSHPAPLNVQSHGQMEKQNAKKRQARPRRNQRRYKPKKPQNQQTSPQA